MHSLTITFLLKKLLPVLLLCSVITARGQQSRDARTYAGPGLSVGWVTTTASWCITAEHVFHSKRNTELAAKGLFTFPHYFDNLGILSGSSYDFRSTEVGLGLEGYLYTGRDNAANGFFFSAGLGAWYSHWKFDYHSNTKRYVRPYGGVGMGAKWKLNDRMAVRWTNTLKMAGPNPDLNGTEMITTSSLLFGF